MIMNIIHPLLFSQAFASSLSGTLATQASLRGVGVGNQEATVAAATMTWLLRGEMLAIQYNTHMDVRCKTVIPTAD